MISGAAPTFAIVMMTMIATSASAAIVGPRPDGDAGGCTRIGKAAVRIAACSEAIAVGEMQGEDVARAYRLRALAHRDAGNFQRALADFGEALRRRPDSQRLLFERAGTFAARGDHVRAVEDYGRALAAGPESARGYFRRGSSYYQLGQFDNAVRDFGAAIRLDPDFAPAYNERAWALYLLGEYPGAMHDVDRALAMRPGMAPARDTRGHILAALGRIDDALAEFEHAMKAGGGMFLRLYQKALVRHGYYVGDADGTDAAGVREALEACLAQHCRLIR